VVSFNYLIFKLDAKLSKFLWLHLQVFITHFFFIMCIHNVIPKLSIIIALGNLHMIITHGCDAILRSGKNSRLMRTTIVHKQ